VNAESPYSHARDPGEISQGRAFVISILVHALLFLIGDNMPRKKSEESDQAKAAVLKEPKLVNIEFEIEDARPPEPEAPDVPLEFVWVDPTTATKTEPPKDTKRFSFASTVASDDAPEIDKGEARIDGIQDKVLQTYNAPKDKPMPLQPLLKKPEAAPEQPKEQPKDFAKTPEQPKPEPKTAPKPKDKPFTVAKKSDPGNTAPKLTASPPRPKSTAPSPEPKPVEPRPRRLDQVKPQLSKLNPGQLMNQDGGAKRKRAKVSIDAKGSELGVYSGKLIEAITQCWYDKLDAYPGNIPPGGRVVVQFRVHLDGRVTETRTASSTVGALQSYFCVQSITEPAPFDEWPESMHRMLGKDYHDVQFTFHY